MPVVTRSQTRKQSEAHAPVKAHAPVNSEEIYMSIKRALFVDEIRQLLKITEDASSKNDKIIAVTNVYKLVNRDLPELLKYYKDFNKFCVCVYDKAIEFQSDYTKTNGWSNIDQAIVHTLMNECEIAKTMIANHVNNVSVKTDIITSLQMKIQASKPFKYITHPPVLRRSPRIASKNSHMF